jgi:formylglycine-generating enzyme required for sulfatase activity
VNIKKLSIVVIIFSSLICSFLIIRSFVETVNTDTLIDYALVDVEGGTFIMGSPPNEEQRDDDECQHQVTVNSFRIGKYEVTQKQWKSVMGSNPSEFKGCDDCPVEKVSWNDVQQFIMKLNEKSPLKYRLPTEEEWEFAARGGTQSRGFLYSGGNTLNSVGWNKSNSDNRTHPVGDKSPNELGIYDMSGNVGEWCQDWYEPYTGCSGQEHSEVIRVVRSGCWFDDAWYCRSSFRGGAEPYGRGNALGFRLAASASE